jgi:hypothetical protein
VRKNDLPEITQEWVVQLGLKVGPSPSLATPPPTGVGEDSGKKEPFYTVGGNVN